MELISPNTNIDFIKMAPLFLVFSALTVLGSLYLWFSMGDSKYGVDFKGGSEFVVSFSEATTSDALRKAIETAGIDNAIVQSFEGGTQQFSVRMGSDEAAAEIKSKFEAALRQGFGDKAQVVRSEVIGPTVGAELRRKALIATVIALVGILIYVSYRFEFAFALGAVVALFHDVIVAMGVYLLAGHTVNMGTIAAALTIVGYSVNDTIVIFDRMREEILKDKDFEIVSLMNRCINQTLARTIVTSLLTFFSALALLVFGGGAISDLSLYLVVGIVAGSYSTIFIASPIVLLWERFRTRKK